MPTSDPALPTTSAALMRCPPTTPTSSGTGLSGAAVTTGVVMTSCPSRGHRAKPRVPEVGPKVTETSGRSQPTVTAPSPPAEVLGILLERRAEVGMGDADEGMRSLADRAP